MLARAVTYVNTILGAGYETMARVYKISPEGDETILEQDDDSVAPPCGLFN